MILILISMMLSILALIINKTSKINLMISFGLLCLAATLLFIGIMKEW